jgi:hypothetical protein
VPSLIGLQRRADADDSYFLVFPAGFRFDPAAASRRRLPILKRTARMAGIFSLSPVRRLAAGAALIDLEATEADEVHRLSLADGLFDPGERARTIASTMAFGRAVSMATPSIKSPRSTTVSCY